MDTKMSRKKSNTQCSQTATARRGSHQNHHDVQVSMLPDLSADLTDEERIWEEILQIKSMPIAMRQKKEMKTQLQNSTKLRLQGLDQIKWQRRKMWQHLHMKWVEWMTKAELWRNSLKNIEGHFGTGVVAYFLFLRWLMFLNVAIFGLLFVFIVLPQLLLTAPPPVEPCDGALNATAVECCADKYFADQSGSGGFIMLDMVKGTGLMERTMLFYGMYTNRIFGFYPETTATPDYDNEEEEEGTTTPASAAAPILFYDLPLAYVLINAVYLLLSLVAIVMAASREFKDRLVEGEGQFYQYCNLVFGGWDFCIHNEKSAIIKHKALHNEIRALVHSQRMEQERHARSREQMLRLVCVRFCINVLVVLILAVAAYTIYVLFNVSMSALYPHQMQLSVFTWNGEIDANATAQAAAVNSRMARTQLLSGLSANNGDSSAPPPSLQDQLIQFAYEFLPYVAITCMNILVPLLFNYLVQFEKYSPMFVVKVTLLRTVFLRLASLMVLLSRFYLLVRPKLAADEQCYNVQWGTPQCWETFVGQQFYKLLLTDFFTHLFVTFFVNFPRALLARHVRTRLARFVGEQEFELPKHVLDIVYAQTLCWLGSFYAPFLPAIAAVLAFLMFYVKKFACLVNSKPASAVLYRASKSNSLFMFVLLVSFVCAVVPVVFAVAEILPSRSCGPFRGMRTVWETVIVAFLKLPAFMQAVIFFFGTAGFAVPCFAVLTLVLYYYYAVSAANKQMVEVLKNQLVLEGHDKQFLLNRLSSFLRQQQEYQQRMVAVSSARAQGQGSGAEKRGGGGGGGGDHQQQQQQHHHRKD